MPQAMNLARELVSFFRQSRRRTWTKNQIIEVIHQAYIKQLEGAVSLPDLPPLRDDHVRALRGEAPSSACASRLEKGEAGFRTTDEFGNPL